MKDPNDIDEYFWVNVHHTLVKKEIEKMNILNPLKACLVEEKNDDPDSANFKDNKRLDVSEVHENAKIYKECTKVVHDKHIIKKMFEPHQKVNGHHLMVYLDNSFDMKQKLYPYDLIPK